MFIAGNATYFRRSFEGASHFVTFRVNSWIGFTAWVEQRSTNSHHEMSRS